jgi:hypothetical protein
VSRYGLLDYGSCSESKELGVGFNFLKLSGFWGFFRGPKGVRDRFAAEAAATDTVIPYYWNSLLSEQDPYVWPASDSGTP